MDSEQIKILEEVAETLKKYKQDIVLCGGSAAHALAYHYRATIPPTFTEDVDIALERRRYKQKSLETHSKQLANELHEHGFEATAKSIPFDSKEKAPEKWNKHESDYYFEFLTEDSKKQNHEIAGVVAQGFSYFNLSLDNRIDVLLPSGNSLPVVSPSAYIVHKLLTYNFRNEEVKKIKDLYYVSYMCQFIFKSPKKAVAEIINLKIHSKWYDTLKKNIKEVNFNIDTIGRSISLSDEYGAFSEKSLKRLWMELATQIDI